MHAKKIIYVRRISSEQLKALHSLGYVVVLV